MEYISSDVSTLEMASLFWNQSAIYQIQGKAPSYIHVPLIGQLLTPLWNVFL